MVRIRKYLFIFSAICIGLFILQCLYIIHLHNADIPERLIFDMPNTENAVLGEIGWEFEVDFTVNDILDNMKHSRSGDFITGNFSAKLPHFIRNQTKESFKREKLKVVVVPHSHNDPGYKKTYSEYFNERTSKILSLAVEKLSEYRDMTFVWPEACFIQRWWNNQTKTTKTKFKHLVKSGRLELASGAWVIPDEATPHYFSYLDQMIEGHYWVKRHLNVIPVGSFDMDQFSLSSTVRYLMEEAGLRYNVLKRVHLGIKDYFMQHKLMNFHWKGPSSNFSHPGVFIQLEPYEWLSFPDSCGPSRSVCEDMDLGHDIQLPVPETPEAEKSIRLLFHRHSSLGSFADKVVRQFKLKSSGYLHNILLLPHGDDYRYDSANEWDRQYSNMKNLMQYINSNEKYNVQMEFGTLKDYFAEVQLRTDVHKLRYPSVGGDFEPYARHVHYWSGFFTTRQFLKRLGRQLQESIRAADILTAVMVLAGKLSDLSPDNLTSLLRRLVSARRELDLFQHHDAITGTSLVQVVKDYAERLSSAFIDVEKVMSFLVEIIVRENSKTFDGKALVPVLHNDLTGEDLNDENTLSEETNADHADFQDGTDTLILYNPLTQARVEIISISINTPMISVLDQRGVKINFDFYRKSKQVKIFFEVNLPPLSISVLQILKSREISPNNAMNARTLDLTQNEKLSCENNAVIVTFSVNDASPIEMCHKQEQVCTPLYIHWRHYIHTGGAYTLSPSNESVNLLRNDFTIRKVSGEKLCVVEVSHKLFKVEYILQNTTGIKSKILQLNVLTNLSRTKTKTFVGEFAMRIVTSINNRHTFYTDSNGFYLGRRQFRPHLPFSSNVYPMTTMAVIKDASRYFTVHSAQPHGVVSLKSGLLDIMIDRVAIVEEMGLNQKVTDNKPTLSRLFLQFEEITSSEEFKKLDILIPSPSNLAVNDNLQHPVIKLLTTKTIPVTKKEFTFLQNPMTCDMVIANMKTLTNEELKVDGVSLTLHRRAVLNLNPVTNHRGKQTLYRSLSPNRLFRELSNSNWKVKEMALTHLKTKKELIPNEQVSFREMEMKTFLFYK